MSLCRGKIRKAKAQTEFTLTMAIKDNGSVATNTLAKKRKAKVYLLPSLDTEGNLLTKDVEKTEILKALFDSVLTSKTSYFQHTQPPELENRDKEQNKVTIIQR